MADPSAWSQTGTANSLADAIRRQAQAQSNAADKTKAKKSGGGLPTSPLDQLMQQIQNISAEETPMNLLMQQATGTAGSQYDPLIAELAGEMARTEKRGKANQGEAKQMYNALATDIAGEMPDITSRMAQATDETQQRYDNTQGELKGQYDKQAAEQAALYKQLGIQAATPGASEQAKDDQAYFQQQSQTDEDAALQMLQEMQQGDVSYNQQSSDNTRLAGVNTAQDIGAQLEEYMQGAGSKMAGLQAGKDSAVSAMLAQLQQQDAERMASQEETEYGRLMDMFNLQLKMQEMQGKQASDAQNSQLFKGTNGPSGASNYLSQMYGSGDTFSSNAIMDVLTGVMSSPEAVSGKYQSPDLKDSMGNPATMTTSPEYLTDMLRNRMQEGDPESPLTNPNFSDMDMNNAINALLAYMGKLK